MRNFSRVFSALLLLCVFLSTITAFTQQAVQNSGKVPAAHNASAQATAADISAAKSAGKVWVNLDSGIYHKSGRWYGKTKNGQFMTVAEAKKAGYRATKRN